MAHMINKQVNYEGKQYILISYNEALDMFQAREVGRLFKTLIPSDVCL